MLPDGFPTFRLRPPWVTCDLQTLRNFLRRPVIDLSDYTGTRVELPLHDGSGDRLIGELNRPAHGGGKPLVTLIHGLTGCSGSIYMQASALHLLRQGHPVLRLNLRGAGPARPLCRRQYHAGRSEDLHDVLAKLPRELTGNGVLAVGYSLGGNMLLKYLAEQGADGPVVAAVSVSAPIDLKAACLCLMRPRNRLYHDWLLRRLREEALAGPGLDEVEHKAVSSVRSIYDFDDRFVAPRNGFTSAEDYYVRCSAVRRLEKIGIPTLLIHALDDPWIPGATYTNFDWRTNPNLLPLLPMQGGHVGFHARSTRVPWHDLCLGIFFDRLCGTGQARLS